MKTFDEFLGEERHAQNLTVVFRNAPTEQTAKVLFEGACVVNEGQTKDCGRGYSTRLDRRSDQTGGDQLHIYGPRGRAWAYRSNGQRSERGKYTFPATNLVKGIVAGAFGIDRSNIEEVVIVRADNQELLIEISFG